MSVKTIPAASLVLDYSLYPRHQIDPTNLRLLKQAIEAGASLPPVVADEASRRVVDGFHRVTLALRQDPEAKIRCELHPFANEQELFKEAVRLNAQHGAKLTPYDHARVLALGDELGITRVEMVSVVGIPLEALERIKATREAISAVTRKPVQVKRSLRPWAGGVLSEEQERVNRRASGMSILFHIDQVMLLLDAPQSPVDLGDEAVADALSRLSECLSRHLATVAA